MALDPSALSATAVALSRTAGYKLAFTHRSNVTFWKTMHKYQPGQGCKPKRNPNVKWDYYIISSYSVTSGGGYICLRNDGRVVALEQIVNATPVLSPLDPAADPGIVADWLEDYGHTQLATILRQSMPVTEKDLTEATTVGQLQRGIQRVQRWRENYKARYGRYPEGQ